MCRVINLGSLDSRTKSFVESYGGYGIVRSEEEIESAVEEEIVVETKKPRRKKKVSINFIQAECEIGGIW